jgi:hypothetical protein
MPALILLFALAAVGQTAEKRSSTKEVPIASFEELIVNANIDVLLLENDTLHTAFIEGDKKTMNVISIKMSGKKLLIESKEKHSFKNKVIVTVPVSGLKVLKVNSHSTIGFLNNIIWKDGGLIFNCDCRTR